MLRLAKWTSLAAALVFVVAATTNAFSQGCALCYTQAASSGGRSIAALKSGILLLVVPAMVISGGITRLAYRKRNQFRSKAIEHETRQL